MAVPLFIFQNIKSDGPDSSEIFYKNQDILTTRKHMFDIPILEEVL